MNIPKNVRVGAFLLAGIILFCVGLFLIGNHNHLFSHHFAVYADFANVDGIEPGAKVRVSGMDAGEVGGVSIPSQASGKFRIKLNVDQKFRNLIRDDSVATIQTAGMVGNQFVNIAKGADNSPLCSGCVLQAKEPVNIGDLMRKSGTILQTVEGTVTDLHQRADGVMKNITAASSNLNGMIASVRPRVQTIASNGANISAGVRTLVAGVNQGKGTVGELLTDQQMASNVRNAVSEAKATVAEAKTAGANVEQASVNVKDASKNAAEMVAEVKTSVGDFLHSPDNKDTLAKLRDTIGEADRATGNLAADTEAIKHNFFLRGFFHRRGFYNLTRFNRTKYEKSKFVRHPGRRIWLPSDGVFTTSPDGAQRLSESGRSAIDQAVSRIADQLANNPIMIEGYAARGTPSQRYVASAERAKDVKAYLQSRYGLNPHLIGTIPLADKPPDGTGVPRWNGICLALVVSKP